MRYQCRSWCVWINVLNVTFVLAREVQGQANGPDAEPARILERAVDAHGGAARLRGIKDLSIELRGKRWMVLQSMTMSAPWTTQPTLRHTVLDFAGNRAFQRGESRYPADFVFASTSIITPHGSFYYDHTRAGFDDVVARGASQPVANHAARREVPALLLLIALDRRETLRFAGDRVEGNLRLQGVTYTERDGTDYTLWVDALSRRLVRTSWSYPSSVFGDVAASHTYSMYRIENGIAVPSRVVEHRNGEIVRDDSLIVRIDRGVSDSLFVPPSGGYREAVSPRQSGPEAESVRRLGDNVWLLQNVGNRVLAVAFRDHLLIFETPTPQTAAQTVMRTVSDLAPGKPIRYVSFSHHHDDHAAGLRPYVSEGATFLTPPRAAEFVKLIAKVKHVSRPDALSTTPREPRIETFTGKRVLADGDMTVELHQMPANSHVDEMVFLYIPHLRLIFQGDLLILPTSGRVGPANQLTMEFAETIERLGLDVQTIAGVHGPVGSIDDLRTAVALRRKAP